MAKDRKPKNKIEVEFRSKGWLDPKGICDFEIEIKKQAKKETAQELLKRIIELNDEQNVFNGQYILTAEDVQDVIRFYYW